MGFMDRGSRLLLISLLGCLASRWPLTGQVSNGRRLLTTAREVHGLAAAEAARGYPVQLRAAVTYYDPYIDSRHGALFVKDASGSIFAAVGSGTMLPLRAGMMVEITGVSGPGD